mmetsp:Transcript_2491/g.5535  ORF Transcript_2491/g.5535 Transcript_2491/m.5535 type:complete len:266 (+) Transcript_2491:1-798(+)
MSHSIRAKVKNKFKNKFKKTAANKKSILHSLNAKRGPLLCAFLTLLATARATGGAGSLLLPMAHASGGAIAKRDPNVPIVPLTTKELCSKLTLCTTLYPWVREFTEEEEKAGGPEVPGKKRKRGTFQALNEDITRVLTTILVTSMACSIFATTLFTHLTDHIFGTYAERWSAVFLTAVTLFFVELLPKNIGVINAEKVARLMVPPINVLANVVRPFGFALSYLAKSTVRFFGVQTKETSGVSDSELPLIVTGVRDSGTSITASRR